jgi:hypothetical protein
MSSSNPEWKYEMAAKIRENKDIDVIVPWLGLQQWLISELTRHNHPFRVFNLGDGLKRITTDTS